MRAITLRRYSLMFAFAAAQIAAIAPDVRADIVPQPNRIRQAFDRLNRTLPDAAQQGYPTAWRQAVERARWDVLDETRANHDRLGDYYQWGLPFQYIYGWSLRHALSRHDDAQRAVRDALELLQRFECEEHLTQAVMAATHIMDAYIRRWRESHALETVRLLDEVESWVMAPATRTVNRLRYRMPEKDGRTTWKTLKNTDAAHVWVSRMYRHQTYFLQNEHLFEPEERQWLKQSRETWLRRVASDRTLPLDVSTPVVTAWAQALYNTGQTELAERCLLAWQQRHGGNISDAQFYAMFMSVYLFGYGDWDRAAAIRAAVNDRADRFNRPTDRREHERLHRIYYRTLALPGYELRRLRAKQIAAYRERIAAADDQRRRETLLKEALQ